MKPLAMHQRALTWLCVYPTDETTNWWKNIAYNVFTLTIFTSLLYFMGSSALFIFKFMWIDLEVALYGVFQVAAILGLIYMSLIAFLLRSKLSEIFRSLSTMYDANKNDDSFRFLEHANNRSEWAWKFYLKLSMGGFFVSTVVMSSGSVLFCWIVKGHFDVKNVYYVYKLILPWDQLTPLGYLAEMCFHILVGEAYFFYNGSLLVLFISICWHHQAFCKIFRNSLNELDRPNRNRNDKEHVCNLIRFHTSVKRWFLLTAEVYSPFILVQLICSVVFMACIVFQLDKQLQHFDFNILLACTGAMVSCSNMFLYCYFGKLATESFAKIANCLYESNWQRHPVDLQKFFILMIGNAQRPLQFNGFGVAVLDLETFAKLLRAACTYYMMFKTIAYN